MDGGSERATGRGSTAVGEAVEARCTVPQAARLLGISERTEQGWLVQLPAVGVAAEAVVDALEDGSPGGNGAVGAAVGGGSAGGSHAVGTKPPAAAELGLQREVNDLRDALGWAQQRVDFPEAELRRRDEAEGELRRLLG